MKPDQARGVGPAQSRDNGRFMNALIVTQRVGGLDERRSVLKIRKRKTFQKKAGPHRCPQLESVWLGLIKTFCR